MNMMPLKITPWNALKMLRTITRWVFKRKANGTIERYKA